MAGLVPAIDVLHRHKAVKTWMPGIKPGMTTNKRKTKYLGRRQ